MDCMDSKDAIHNSCHRNSLKDICKKKHEKNTGITKFWFHFNVIQKQPEKQKKETTKQTIV